MIMRREEPADHRAVEDLTREAFWGMFTPRCDEHLLVHRLRKSGAFVPELDVVAEVDGALVGSIVFSRAQVVGEGGPWDVLTFGPLSVLPTHQGSGVGGALMRYTLAEATRLGHRVVVVYGHPDYYPKFGFRRGSEVGITAPGGMTFDALMVLELVEGGLDGVRGEFHMDPAFHLDPEDAEAFDATFPAKEPAVLTPVDVLDGHVPVSVREALRAHEVGDLETVRRFSYAEVTAWDGVGVVGGDALRAFMVARGLPWGPPQGGGSR
jgi:predicted N-acetyltransferase YhbS